MSESNDNVPESAYEIGQPPAKHSDNVVPSSQVQLANFQNYPPGIKHMTFSIKTLPPQVKRKVILLFINHILMIIGPLVNIVVCILEVVFGGIKQPVLKLVLSIIFFFIWTITGYFHFYHGNLLLVSLRGRAIAYYIAAFFIAIRFALWSVFDWGDANGFVAMVKLFSKGNIGAGVLSIFYIALTIPVAIITTLGAIFVYRR